MKSVSFDLDQNSKVKLYFQLYKKLSEQISQGQIPAGTKLPSVRVISNQLDISRNTVTKAYEMLQNDGYIIAREKSGFFAASMGQRASFLNNVSTEETSSSISTPEPQEEADDSIPTVEGVIKQRMGAFANFDSDELLKLSREVSSHSASEPEETLSSSEPSEEEEFSGQSFSEMLEEEYPQEDLQQEEEEFTEPPFTAVEEKEKSTEEKLIESFSRVMKENHDWQNLEAENFGQYELRISIAQHTPFLKERMLTAEQILVLDDPIVSINDVLSTLSLEQTAQKLEKKGLLRMATQALSTSSPRKVFASLVTTDHRIHSLFQNDVRFEEVKIFTEMNEEALQKPSPQDILVLFVDSTAGEITEAQSLALKDFLKNNPQDWLMLHDTAPASQYMAEAEKITYTQSFSTLIHGSLAGSFTYVPESLLASLIEKSSPCRMSLLDQYAISNFLINQSE